MNLNKYVLLSVVVLVVMAVSGCETLKGAGKGVKKDAENISENIRETDAWMTEHMW